MRAPEARQISVRTGTRRRLEPRYLITAPSRAHPTMGRHGGRGPSRTGGVPEAADRALPLRPGLALGALARGLRGPGVAAVASPRARPGHGARRPRRGARLPPRSHPDREHVRRSGPRRDRRRLDPSAPCGRSPHSSSSSTPLWSPSPVTVRRRRGSPSRSGSSRATRPSAGATRTRCRPTSCSCAGSSGTSAGPTSRPRSRRSPASARRGRRSSGPGTGGRPMRRPPSGPRSPRPGSRRLPSRRPRGTCCRSGRQRLVGPAGAFDPSRALFDFVGDGGRPA